MALDYVEILKRVEAHYPQAAGASTSQDVALKNSITGFANDLFTEIDREQRWSMAFADPSFTTTPGTASYTLPFPTGATNLIAPTFIQKVWYTDPTNGRLYPLERFNRDELQRVYGDYVASPEQNTGAPTRYTVQSVGNSWGVPVLQLILYPTPDANGPSSGNYSIVMSGYFNTPPIVETVGTSVGLSGNLTIPTNANNHLAANGIPQSSSSLGLYLSVRGAGGPGVGGIADTHVTTWASYNTTTVVMGSAAIASNSGQQAFFNSRNWMISQWPKLVLFGILREVASYYGDTEKYTLWEQRYQDQLKRARDYEFSLARTKDARGIAYAGANASALRDQSYGYGLVDVRGGPF